MTWVYKNWFIHNMVGHPMSEIAYWVFFCLKGEKAAEDIAGMIHEATIPPHEPGTGRG